MNRHVQFDHTADVGFDIFARTLPQLFDEAAKALLSVIYKPHFDWMPRKYAIYCSGLGLGQVFHEFLNTILYESNTNELVLSKVRVFFGSEPELSNVGCQVDAVMYGWPLSDRNGRFVKGEVKAVTFCEYVPPHYNKERKEWHARVVFDV